jgi:hypothetical protein
MSQLTVANIIDIAAASQWLAQKNLQRYPVARSRQEKLLPSILYCERKSLKWAYDNGWDAEELRATANYVLALCGNYSLEAQSRANIGGGLVVVGETTAAEAGIFPIRITEAAFTTPTFYPDIRLANYANVYPRLEEINRMLNDGEFTITSSGLTILLDGFDADNNTYTITLDQYSTP